MRGWRVSKHVQVQQHEPQPRTSAAHRRQHLAQLLQPFVLLGDELRLQKICQQEVVVAGGFFVKLFDTLQQK